MVCIYFSQLRLFAVTLLLLFITNICTNTAAAYATQTTISVPHISEIYPNALGSSEIGKEFIELYNPGITPVDLAAYSIQLKDNPGKIMALSGSIEPLSYVSFITSFSLLNGGGTIQLLRLNQVTEVFEEVTYGHEATDVQSWSYFSEGWELTPVTRDLANVKYSQEPIQPTVCDEGYELNDNGVCVLQASPNATTHCELEISEISAQPNLNGNEYIEFINNSNVVSSVHFCKVSINDGAQKILPDFELAPGERYVYIVSSGTIKNTSGEILLIDSNNNQLAYTYLNTTESQVINYTSGQLSGTVSEKATPYAANETTYNTPVEVDDSSVSAVLEPCEDGKYRNPETNRCKSNASGDSTLTPCAANQQRNPQTNRCSKITVASASLTPCSESQERNPETNRCRKIGSTAGILTPCDEGQERNPQTNRCRKVAAQIAGSGITSTEDTETKLSPYQYRLPLIIIMVTAFIGYGVYEYRTDIQNFLQNIRHNFLRGRPPS